MVEGPICAVTVCCGELLLPPVYQNTVFADVPATSDVDVAGVPLTRSGGSLLKKSLAAAMAEAAGNCVCASVVMAPVKAV